MKVVIRFTLILLIFSNRIYSQGIRSLDSYKEDLKYTSKLFFDDKIISPSYTGDSLKLNLGLAHYSLWMGSISLNDYNATVDGFIKKYNSGIGLSFAYQDKDIIKYRDISAFYSHRFIISENVKLGIGAEVGVNSNRYLNSYTLQDPLISANSSWINNPIINVGANLDFVNQRFGISYKNEEQKIDVGSLTDYNERNKIVLNYKIRIKLSGAIFISPEVVDLYNFNSNTTVLLTKLSFKNQLFIGALYDTENDYSLMIAVRLFKRFELGWDVDYLSKYSATYYNGLFVKLLIN